MDGRVAISESELLEAVRTALQRDPGPNDAWTREELEVIMGCCETTAQRRIRKLVKQGLWEFAGKKPGVQSNGVPRLIDAYRPVRS